MGPSCGCRVLGVPGALPLSQELSCQEPGQVGKGPTHALGRCLAIALEVSEPACIPLAAPGFPWAATQLCPL